MMTKDPVKIGMIGCGGYAHQLILRILSIPDAIEIAAVTSRNVNSEGARYCEANGIEVVESVEQLLARDDIEAVLNPTPIHLHAETTRLCMEAGFPVFLEKPPLATVQELDALNAEAGRLNRPVAVCFNSLYSNLQQQLKRELVSGKYGKVLRVKGIAAWVRTAEYFSRNSWAGKLQVNGQWILDGDLNNPLAHVLCNNLFFAAPEQNALAEPVSVTAELYRCNPIESEDTSCVRVITREGIEVLTWLTLGSETEIVPATVIETEQADITFKGFNSVIIRFKDGKTETRQSYQEHRIEMLRHFGCVIRAGEPLLCSLEMTRPFTVVVNAAFDSVGTIHTIPDVCCETRAAAGSTQTVINNMHDIMMRAFDANRLFSENDVPWAVSGQQVNTENYNHFPVRFDLNAGVQPSAEAVLRN